MCDKKETQRRRLKKLLTGQLSHWLAELAIIWNSSDASTCDIIKAVTGSICCALVTWPEILILTPALVSSIIQKTHCELTKTHKST